MRIFFIALISAFGIGSLAADAVERGESTVTIPLEQYLSLKKANEVTEFASVESVAISGEYRGRLQIKISGGASLPAREIPFMDYQNNVDLTDCRGSAVLLVKDQRVHLIPQEKRFQMTCDLQIKNWSEVRLRFHDVLSLTAKVKGVEPMESPKGSGEREVVLYRADREIASVVEEEPSAVGHYKIQMLTDENRFEYRLALHNPNAKAKSFTFELVNGEVVQKVTTQAQYKEGAGKINFTLSPGDHHVRITGRLPKDEFKAPIAKGLEYVLLDQHPLLTSQVDTTAKRISAQDTKISASFPSPRGYLFSGKEQMRWVKQKLETFTATTYTIRSADYRYYWAKMGKNLVEATFVINNQGAPEIPLTIKGKPTYVEINGAPQVLSRNDKNQLILRVPTGDYQSATVQYQLDNPAPRGLASITEALPRPETTMTNVAVRLNVPSGYHHIFATNGVDQSWAMSLWSLMWALLAGLLVYKFLSEVAVRPLVRYGASVAVTTVTFLHVDVLVWLAITLFIAVAIRYRHKLAQYQLKTWRDYAKVISFMIILATGIYITRGVSSFVVNDLPAKVADETSYPSAPRSIAASPRYPAFGAAKKAMMQVAPPPAEIAASMDGVAEEMVTPEAGAALSEDLNYQGLPAKIEIPNDGYAIGFRAGLLDPGTPIEIKATILPDQVTKILYYLACLVLLFTVWWERRALVLFLTTQSKT